MMFSNTVSEQTLLRISALPCQSLQQVLSIIMSAIENDLPKTDIALAAAVALHAEETGSPSVKPDTASLGLLMERIYKRTHPGVIRRSVRTLIKIGVLDFDHDPKATSQTQTNKIVRQGVAKPQSTAMTAPEKPDCSDIADTLSNVVRRIAETNPGAVETLEVLRPVHHAGRWVLTGPSDLVLEHIESEYGHQLTSLWKEIANSALPPLRVVDGAASSANKPKSEPTPAPSISQSPPENDGPAGPTPDVLPELTAEFLRHACQQIMASGPITDRSEVLAWILHMVFITPRQPEKYNAHARLRGVIKLLRERRLRRPGGFNLDRVKEVLGEVGLRHSQLRDGFTDGPLGMITPDDVALVVQKLNQRAPNSKRNCVPLAWVLYQVFCDPGNAQSAWSLHSRIRGTLGNIDKGQFRRPTLFSAGILKAHLQAGGLSAYDAEQICSETILRAA